MRRKEESGEISDGESDVRTSTRQSVDCDSRETGEEKDTEGMIGQEKEKGDWKESEGEENGGTRRSHCRSDPSSDAEKSCSDLGSTAKALTPPL